MEKEKYEKPEIEIIDLLSEIFTEDSLDPEETGGDVFDDDEQTNDGTTEGDVDEDGNPIEKSNDGLTSMPPEASDPALLGALLNELSNISEDIQSSMSGGVETSDGENSQETESYESEAIEDTPVENNPPVEDTFEEPTQPSGEAEGFE